MDDKRIIRWLIEEFVFGRSFFLMPVATGIGALGLFVWVAAEVWRAMK